MNKKKSKKKMCVICKDNQNNFENIKHTINPSECKNLKNIHFPSNLKYLD